MVFKLTFVDFIYRYFFWAGSGILKMYSFLPEDIKRAGMRLHYEVYASIVGFLVILSSLSSIFLIFILNIALAGLLPLIFRLIISLILMVLPAFVLVFFGMAFPKLLAANRVSSYDQEAPYAVAYLGIMTSGGMSPYIALERLGYARTIFKKISLLATRFTVMVRAIGWDPMTAMEDIAKRNPSTLLRDLVMGFIATLRAGGDIADYLRKKSTDLFNALVTKIKASGERMSVILESYLAVAFILLLTLNAIYLVSLSITNIALPGINEVTLFISSYVVLPFMSGLMLYLSDMVQYKEPGMELGPYKIFFLISFPIIIALSAVLVAPYFIPPVHPFFKYTERFRAPIRHLMESFNVSDVYAPGMGFAISLSIATIPAAVADYIICGRQRKIAIGIVRFLRDLVEVRKTGLSPEKCIVSLANRDYGLFTKYLREIATQISLGFSLTKILERAFKKIRSWRARVFLYVLTEAIEVGGGTPEALENIAHFAELTENLERERSASLRTLIIIPYLGAIVIISSIVLLTSFMSTAAAGIVAYTVAAKMVVPAAILNVYFMGLVAGKTSAGTVSSGFKHAALLCAISLLTIFASPYLAEAIRGISGG